MEGKQQIHVKLYSSKIHELGDGLVDYVKELVGYFFDTLDGVSIQVSRLDLYSDVSRDDFLERYIIGPTNHQEKLYGL